MSKSPLLLALLLAIVPVMAQQGLPPGLTPPADGEPKDPTPEPARAMADQALPDPNAIQTPAGKRWELLSEDGNGVALLYHRLTGKTVLVSSQAALAEISMILPGPLTNGQAARFLEKKLLMEGFSLETSGPMELKLVLAAGAAASTKTEGQRVIGSIDELTPGTDEYVRWVMPLEYLKPEEAARVFQQVVGQFGPAGSVAAIPNASSVIISGNSPLLRLLDELRVRIDVPSAKVAQSFVTVEYADVEELATQLNELFNQQSGQGSSARVQRTQQPASPIPGMVGNAQGGGGGAGEDTPINILADLRTNRIFLMGRPVDIAFVESLIKDFDAPSSDRNFLRKKLKYLRVVEFMPIAQDALEGVLGATGGGGSVGGIGGASSRNRNTTTTNNNRGLQSNNQNTTGGAGGSSGGSRAGVSGQEGQTAPESVVIGKTLLVADNISNSIVVKGPPHHVEIVEKLVEQLDQPSQQIAITAVFGRYDLGDNTSFGFDLAQLALGGDGDSFAFQNRNLSGDGVPSIIDVNELTDLTGLLNSAGAGSGLSLYGTAGDFGAFVNALEATTKFTALDRPTIFTTNNKTARISSGQRVAVPTSSFTGGSSTGLSTNIEFRDIVLELEVLPLVNDKNEVTLDIALVRDGLGDPRTFVGVGEVPDIDTEEISTIVTVPNRATIVLGGLITESDRTSKSGVPILMNIPVLGNVFSQTDHKVSREELVILIHATVIDGHSDLEDYQREYDATGEVGPRSRTTFQQSLLPEKGEVIPRTGKGIPAQPRPQSAMLAEPEQKPRKKSRTRNGRRF